MTDERVQTLRAAIEADLALWKLRLGISEHVTVEIFDDGDPEARCAMKPARVTPEAQGLWDFVLEVSAELEDDEVERTVVHELVHLMLEPLRSPYFAGRGLISDDNTITWPTEQEWETVIQRAADAYMQLAALGDSLIERSSWKQQMGGAVSGTR